MTGLLWPAVLGPATSRAGQVRLRPLRRGDGQAWRDQRIVDEDLLHPWEASDPTAWPDRHTRGSWTRHRRSLLVAARRAEAAPFAIEVDGAFAGQVTVGGVRYGVQRSGWVGYWVSSAVQGHGVATISVALVLEHLFTTVGLHRIEATIAPANVPSRTVVGHLGFRQEGLLRDYLHVGGSWTDHLLFAITAPEWRGRFAEVVTGVSSKG